MADKPTPVNTPQLEVIVLAAGQGKRMRSALPKVLHPIGGRPMLTHVLETLTALRPMRVHVVVGFGAEQVQAQVQGPVNWVHQAQQQGTGHAVKLALADVDDASTVLVVFGDVPLVSASTLVATCAAAEADGGLVLVSAEFDDPAQLGRIVRDQRGAITAIVEYADASDTQRQIREINSGIMALNAAGMKKLLERVQPANAQGEYYLTDLVELALRHNIPVTTIQADTAEEIIGVNNRAQLAQLERIYQQREISALMESGVSMADPQRVDVRGRVVAGEDCFIDINVVFEGEVRLGRGVSIGPGCVIRDSVFGDDVRLEAHTVVDGASIADGCQLGPFARLRPGSDLKEDVKIGNFVEVKKSTIGRGSKASHLSYLGDATLGEDCNVGAGTVTCNYDGIAKHSTEIGDRVFVGTNSTLVAPLVIDDEAYVAAGSTITTRIGFSELGVGRGRQRNITGWIRPDRRKPKES